MSTVQRDSDVSNTTWKISSKAVDKLKCFMNGLDEIVVSIALNIAKKRMGDSNAVVRIESTDIDRAADLVLEQIRSQVGTHGILASDIEMMDECRKAKT